MIYKFCAGFVLLFLVMSCPAVGQDGTQKGVVWDPPQGISRAQLDLREMADVGVQAVRTGIIRRSELLTLADTLGIALYVDLPISHLPAMRLRDTLAHAAAVLDTVLGIAQIHTSIRHIGLARQADTSDSTACRYLTRLVERGRRSAPAGTRFYYASRFIDDDVCSAAVDFVLLDARDRKDPAAILQRWRGESPAGLGAAGVWVRGDTLDGLRVPSSLARQARYFESHLPVLLSDTLSPPAIFVYRWRDQRRAYPSPSHDLGSPYVVRYGLHAVDGSRRPALDVVSGIYTGRQSVFAFERGDEVLPGGPWTTIMGWAVILLLGTFYALSPRFRHMIPRYFQAHFFFREAVREGRDVLFGTSIVLLTSLGIACALITLTVLDILRTMDAFGMALRWFPESLQVTFVTLLAKPWVLIVLVGCVYVLALLVWTVLLSVFSRRRYPVAPSQVLMLVVWPRWTLLLVMVASMVVASMPAPNLMSLAALLGAWMIIELVAMGRTLYDLIAVTRMPLYLLPLSMILHPGVLLAITVAISLLPYGPELTFLRNVVLRS